jgi:hypothetical protein
MSSSRIAGEDLPLVHARRFGRSVHHQRRDRSGGMPIEAVFALGFPAIHAAWHARGGVLLRHWKASPVHPV